MSKGGGYITAHVNKIGIHEEGSTTLGPYQDNAIMVNISEYDLKVIREGGSIPTDFHYEPNDKIVDYGTHEIDVRKINWVTDNNFSMAQSGKIFIEIKGEKKLFYVSRINAKNGYIINISRQYKKWIWYPAQTLKLLSYPLDGVTYVLIIVVLIIATMLGGGPR